ncbi:MAG: DUF2851 family protein [Bacteroidota bacterium]
MKEDFLHYLWRTKQFDLRALTTTQGAPINIHTFGLHNQNAGPDFLDARVSIGNVLWAGNIEMHLKASDWLLHKHQNDRSYDNVVLHVVYEEDRPICYPNGHRIPCLELKGRIPPGLSKRYQRLQGNAQWVACEYQLSEVPKITRNLWLDRMMIDRLEAKTALMAQVLAELKGDWEEVFHRFLASGFGLYVNRAVFEQLARIVPLSLLRKYRHSLLQVEALLFGQAGFLEADWNDKHPVKLKRTYQALRQKHQLVPLSMSSWKFSRMRPAGFPSVRIAQFAGLVFQSEHLFSKMLAAKNIQEIENAFDFSVSKYWQCHYRFDQESIKQSKKLGRDMIRRLIINVIAPILFLYGKQRSEDQYKDLALHFLGALPPESNRELRQWKSVGIKTHSALRSQALLQLKKSYCDKKRCMECAIGHSVLKMGKHQELGIR